MKSYLRLSSTILAAFLLCIPISIILTLLLIPLWSWIEKSFNIESIGHSGPDEWCYLTVYIILVTISILGYFKLLYSKK
jgi:hypothetical protein